MESWVPCKFPPGIIKKDLQQSEYRVVGSLQIPPWYNPMKRRKQSRWSRGFPANSPLV